MEPRKSLLVIHLHPLGKRSKGAKRIQVAHALIRRIGHAHRWDFEVDYLLTTGSSRAQTAKNGALVESQLDAFRHRFERRLPTYIIVSGRGTARHFHAATRPIQSKKSDLYRLYHEPFRRMPTKQLVTVYHHECPVLLIPDLMWWGGQKARNVELPNMYWGTLMGHLGRLLLGDLQTLKESYKTQKELDDEKLRVEWML